MTPRFPLTYAVFVAYAATEPQILGLILKGSHAHDGMPTEHSDHDVYVVVTDDASADLVSLNGHRSADLDLIVVTVDELRRLNGHERYALVRSQVLLDRLDGGIARIVAAKNQIDDATQQAADWLDAYANSLYRSVKNARDGHALASRLDAADSVRFLLELLFTLDCRPRPYNKYLEWELERFPLPGWETATLLAAIGQISSNGDVDRQRHLFAQVEAVSRKAGHGATLDAWGDDLLLMRPDGIVSPLA
jgi:hypothetical protein